jgi:hypothetical protein
VKEAKVNRRAFIVGGFSAFIGGVLGATVGRVATPPVVVTEEKVEKVEVTVPLRRLEIPAEFRFDWKYVAERAFSGYKAVCCCFGVATPCSARSSIS